MSRFTKALIVSPLADGKTWVLIEPFAYDVGELGSGDTIEVSKGFKTDFASIHSKSILDSVAKMGEIR